jgi:hypothetical protein
MGLLIILGILNRIANPNELLAQYQSARGVWNDAVRQHGQCDQTDLIGMNGVLVDGGLGSIHQLGRAEHARSLLVRGYAHRLGGDGHHVRYFIELCDVFNWINHFISPENRIKATAPYRFLIYLHVVGQMAMSFTLPPWAVASFSC